MKFNIKGKSYEFENPVVMGILNLTPDSFSDGGRFNTIDKALFHVEEMINQGVNIIDVGGESTRPGAEPVSLEMEIDRVAPVVEAVKKNFDILVSIDTYKSKVADICINQANADIINDISGLRFDSEMVNVVRDSDSMIIIMHIKGTPRNMQRNPYYDDVVKELIDYFNERISFAIKNKIKRDKIILDPGIGFGKRLEDNIEIIRKMEDFKTLGYPILIGLSRKSFLGMISSEKEPYKREPETIAANIISFLNGADILRVHNVENLVKSIRVVKELI